jgi:hypothetical protein
MSTERIVIAATFRADLLMHGNVSLCRPPHEIALLGNALLGQGLSLSGSQDSFSKRPFKGRAFCIEFPSPAFLHFHLNAHRAVVGTCDVGEDEGPLDRRHHLRGDEHIVDPPAHVPFPCAGFKIPPAILN